MRVIPVARDPSWSELAVMVTVSRGNIAKRLFESSKQDLGALAFGEEAVGNHPGGYVAALICTAHRHSQYLWEAPTDHGE